MFPTNPFLARLIYYRHLCKPYWISRPEARRLYEMELMYGVLWREALDEILYLHRTHYCTPDRPKIVYVPVWQDGALLGWEEEDTCDAFEEDTESFAHFLKEWFEEENR